jgi:quercetin dioxygenase-like cupin family protein
LTPSAPRLALPHQMNDGQNRVGLIVDPERDQLPFSFTVEVFEAGTVTEMAVNPGFELFYVLQGKGTAFCEGEKVRRLDDIHKVQHFRRRTTPCSRGVVPA